METPMQDENQPIVNIVGEKVALGPIRRELVPLYARWLNDFEVGSTYFGGTLIPETREAAEARYDRLVKEQNEGRGVAFTIYERATLRPVGLTLLDGIDHYNRVAGFGIVIGEKDCWDKGYGTETAVLMLDYAFTVLGLHALHLTVFSYNERAIRAYTKAGFRVVGRWREAKRLGARVHDVVCMDCLASEFESPTLGRLLPG